MSDARFEHPLDQLATYRELTPAERQAVQAHLATCDDCRSQFQAFQRQDTHLAVLPARLPRRRLEFAVGKRARFWNGLARLGDTMAVAGTAIAGLALAFIARAIATAPAPTGSPPAAPAAPGVQFALRTDLTALVNPWVLAAPWIGLAVAIVGVLFALGKRSRVWPGVGVLISGLLVCTYVPPATVFPNPVGIIWYFAGGYSYDPNLPFKNLFIVSGDPTAKLRPYMDRLIGQVGLDPLDPVQPLARYAFERVTLPHDHNTVLVTTRFVYANGASRVYDVPLFDPANNGFYVGAWQNDGLSRLRTQHLALPGQSFADLSSPIRLGDAVRLKLSPQADRLDAIYPKHWAWLSNRLQRLVWSPQGDAFLMVTQGPDRSLQLWLIPLDGSAPQAVTNSGKLYEYGWSPDGRFVVYTAAGEAPATAHVRSESTQIVVVRHTTLEPVARRIIANVSLPSLTQQGLWFTQDGALWLLDWNTSEASRVANLADVGHTDLATPPTFWPVAVSPDASRVAYACDADLCLMSLDSTDRRVVRVRASDIRAITWDWTGTRLAAVSLDMNNLGPVKVLIVARDGILEHSAVIAPRDATDPPQWTADGRFVFVQTFPMGGRRILTVNADTGEVLDLSREHWDAYFALSPDGKSVLLNNGRGGFWLAPVVR